VVALWPPIG